MNPFIDWKEYLNLVRGERKREIVKWRDLSRGGYELLKLVERDRDVDEVIIKISQIKDLLNFKLDTSCYKVLRELLRKDFIESRCKNIYWVNPFKIDIKHSEIIYKYSNLLKRDYPSIYMDLNNANTSSLTNLANMTRWEV